MVKKSMIIFEILIGFLAFIFLIVLVSSLIGVPCLPTHLEQAKRMVELAGLKPGMNAVDLGSGFGRLIFLSVQSGAKITGYELNPFLVVWTKFLIKRKHLSKMAHIKWKSIYDADLKNADVVFAFLLPKPMQKLAPKLFSELKPGSTIISYAFPMKDHEPVMIDQGIFVYKV